MLRKVRIAQIWSPQTAFGLLAVFFLLAIAPAKVMAEKIPIYYKQTTADGCTMEFKATLDTLARSISGSAVFGGPHPPCRKGLTVKFFVMPNSDVPNRNPKQLSGKFDADNLREVQSITWSGPDERVVEMLSDRNFNEKFVREIRRAVEKAGSKNNKGTIRRSDE